ncbi:metallophosphoesterase [Stenotrophomonas sp. Iso1]|uniref:metallophosphoesterase n=1 Tax=Stenotrophomonas sp. Iso1 TaxID=2977283 RepID=UPI0022B7D42E|nr:metallophosphoesterase [Stenotrophomonas sp. Iso1]
MNNSNRVQDGQILQWLHFSDAHIGMKEQKRLWARPLSRLKDDLRILLDKTGKIDVIIFTGDMTQFGSKQQFAAFGEEISELLYLIENHSGLRPKLVTVPGNHDLCRPDKLRPELMAIKQFWLSDELRDGIWNKSESAYIDFFKECFFEYSEWLRSAIADGTHVEPVTAGILPGDAAYTIGQGPQKTGIVALNSAWLQLGPEDYRGRLHVDTLQLIEVIGNHPDEWLQKNGANILITHHPVDWLHQSSQNEWSRDINPAGRFDLHLFGHMHEHQTRSIAFGGGQRSQSIQASSLFGLEYDDGKRVRIQGYSAGALTLSPERRFTSWPRKLLEISGGDVKYVPDSTQDIDELSSSFTIKLERRSPNPSQMAETISQPSNPLSPTIHSAQSRLFDLARIRRPAVPERSHQKVRRVEQEAVIASLKARKITWISSEWGLGEEAFASCIEKALIGSGVMYSIDFTDYLSREAFLDRTQQNLGASFQNISEAISDSGPSLVIFSGVEIDRTDEEARTRQLDIEDLARTFSDFAPDTFVLITSRSSPRASAFGSTELRPLDEADLAVYLKESDSGSSELVTADVVSRIMRHTDGVPDRIDLTLRELEVGSIDDLTPSNPDLAFSATTLVAAPTALVETVTELRLSEARQERRAYSLLLALSTLPQGEQLSRLKRFFGPDPVLATHALELLSRSLIKTRSVASENSSNSSTDKILVVPKVVRDHVRESISLPESRSLDRKALDLYFGESWAMGDISSSQAAKRIGEALCDGYEIQNMSALVFRAVARAIDSQENFDLGGALRLAISFIKILSNGNHYRAAASVCEDMLGLMLETDSHTTEVNTLRKDYAECLRMTGRSDAAIDNFEQVDRNAFSKTVRQRTELHMALCYRRLKRYDEARSLSNSLIKISRNSAAANHARSILANLTDDASLRIAELRNVLATALKSKHYTVASNIRMDLAAELEDEVEAREILREAMKNASDLGFYTVARQIVQLASMPGAAHWLTPFERTLLIDAYYYLYNERLLPLFGTCHAALWDIFEREGDTANLFKLFRHSSFVWRLSGKDDLELNYVQKLAGHSSSIVSWNDSSIDRNKAYLVVRLSIVLGEREIQLSDDS